MTVHRTPLELELLELLVGIIAYSPQVTCHSRLLAKLLVKVLDDATCHHIDRQNDQREEVNT